MKLCAGGSQIIREAMAAETGGLEIKEFAINDRISETDLLFSGNDCEP
ncbi:hypothetical protein GGE45_006328 [Rhizobium aethiopicum]|uniref:Uncharacterized protein n=1 Tax=Rhizobium aethiopicum TaxID=1138170 RepID=A0A7W6VSC9_9HYPH|nr:MULTISPECIES: hypothetical protein [Rhizobium]MBB4195386.1 hypothetical protein [Rhizobium aethiopicum]MBB4583946.1 hypothetical protein [Rhizobium aethiopicum]MDO3437025.1 hypothetical protein [Rhizobium sp. CBN3]